MSVLVVCKQSQLAEPHKRVLPDKQERPDMLELPQQVHRNESLLLLPQALLRRRCRNFCRSHNHIHCRNGFAHLRLESNLPHPQG